jgi:hypothetical protein
VSDPCIARSLVEICIFLECSSDEIVDPDAAVTAMEQLAANLQRGNEGTKRALVAAFAALAPSYPGEQEFVASLGSALGLE